MKQKLTNEEIGARIEARRISIGMTMDELAEQIGVNKSTIHRYEKGQVQRLKLPVIESIALALNVNPAWLTGNADDPAVVSDTRRATDEDIKFALFGDADIDDAVLDEVRRFAEYARQQHERNKEQ